MCTAFFVLDGAAEDGDGDGASTSASTYTSSPLSLLLLFNRDEFLDRETATAHFWADHPAVLAGRDLRRGGTWVGVTTAGRWALLTNFRERSFSAPGAPSRGVLPTDFLTGTETPFAYATRVAADAATSHNGFNLVVGDSRSAVYLTNRGPADAPGFGAPVRLSPGVYGLSNGPLGGGEGGAATGWVKVDAGVAALRRLLASGALSCASPTSLPWPTLFGSALMGCAARAPPDALPITGIPPHIEAALSSTFIPPAANLLGGGAGVAYGTRSQTGVAILADGRAALVERSARVVEGGGGEGGEVSTSSAPRVLPLAWTEVVHEFRVESTGDADLVLAEAGGCASPEAEAGGLVGT